LLADHPSWAEEVRREGDNVLRDAVVAEDLETTSRLKIAAAVANEAMRLRPVAPVGLLEANIDTVIGNVQVPRGTTVVILPRPAAVSDDHFADARAFRPERWLTGLEGVHDLSAHIPFGSAPRICPGRSLALTEMNTLLCMLYKNFYVDRIGISGDVKEYFGFTMSPLGLNVRLKART
jgi:cytochrome P450